MHENDYAYNPDLESELSSNRSVLRTVLLLYNGEVHSSEMVNSIVEKWERKHSSINSIVGVSVTGVSDKPQSNLSADCPNCFCGFRSTQGLSPRVIPQGYVLLKENQ